jgi:hypothetical protein
MPGVEGGEVIAQQAGITVLVFSREAKVRTVQRSVEVLGELGSTPSWALLTESTALSPLRWLVRRFDVGGEAAPFSLRATASSVGWKVPASRNVLGGSSAQDLNLVD